MDCKSKKTWSLQQDKRTESQRSMFQPTGKTVKKNDWRYVLSVLLILLLMSYLFTFFTQKKVAICFTQDICFNSYDNRWVYVLFVYFNVLLLVFGVYFAYRFGSYLGKKLKR